MKYVVAVSGGVDSIVLLDMLIHGRCKKLQIEPKNIVVAHFDHGIREDSSSDEKFVRGVVGEYGLLYESKRVELGPKISEAAAREARYNFLRQICKKHNAPLLTAHHQDDLIETMLINLLRGTNWRGLVPMADSNLKSQAPNNKQFPNPNIRNSKHDQLSNNNYSLSTTHSQQILRPLLDMPKFRLLEYAKKYHLKWREDSTNNNTAYLRNYVRLELLPRVLQKDPQAKQKLLDIYNQTTEIKIEIATELQKNTIKYQISNIKYEVPRYLLIMWPLPVSQEVIYHILTQLDSNWHPSSQQILRVAHFIKTGWPYKYLEVSGGLNVALTKSGVQFKKV